MAMEEHLLIREFLDEVRQRAADDHGGHDHRAFVAWYVEAEYGDVKYEFTDDCHDGGIDAIVYRPGEVPPFVVLQSKFSRSVNTKTLSASAYAAFDDLVERFRTGDPDDRNGWLEGVRDDL